MNDPEALVNFVRTNLYLTESRIFSFPFDELQRRSSIHNLWIYEWVASDSSMWINSDKMYTNWHQIYEENSRKYASKYIEILN